MFKVPEPPSPDTLGRESLGIADKKEPALVVYYRPGENVDCGSRLIAASSFFPQAVQGRIGIFGDIMGPFNNNVNRIFTFFDHPSSPSKEP